VGRFFEARKAQKFARWDRMAKMFTRLGKDITIAVKAGGPDPDSNPRLRRVLQNCRAASMPRDNIEGAIKRAMGTDQSDYAEVIYEGYAPHGVPILVVTATDNVTRTVANIRMHFNKGGGNMGSSGSVQFMFNHMGVFRLDPEGIDRDELELSLIDFGLEELVDGEGEKGEPLLIVRCPFTSFGDMQTGLEQLGIETVSTDDEHIPTTWSDLTEEQEEEVLKCVDRLEEDEDVQKVFHNIR